MIHTRRILLLSSILFFILISGGLALLPAPMNPLWHLFSGYYRYDPRSERPPKGLMLDRPEDSLHYYLDATLAACDRRYPPIGQRSVQDYEVEAVEYFGKTSYHAFSHVHTRLFFTDGSSVLVTFRFEAGHNEADVWYLDLGSTIRAGSWVAVSGLVESPSSPPPGWRNTGSTAYRCEDTGHPRIIGQ
jgi:hypothetical protein